MKFNSVVLTIAIFILAIGDKEFLHAVESSTQQPAAPTTISTPQVVSTTKVTSESKSPVSTLQAKTNMKNSEICKKCSCDMEYLKLDCSNKSMTRLFTNDEWKILQNGDVMFKTIKMNDNEISYVPQIPTYPVKSLYLSRNKINNISIAAFQNLTELAELDLSHNLLTSKSLSPHVFKGKYATDQYQPLRNLKSLNLADNEMHTLNSDIFEHISNLDTLILKKNSFEIIDTSTTIAISSLSSLKTLDMSFMKLSEIPDTIFHGPNELETLILTGNLFHTLPGALTRALHLRKLILDENPLGDIDNTNVFKSLRELEYLSISYLPDITKIGPGAFSELQSLNTLVVGDNPHLAQIHGMAFAKNTSNPDLFDYPPLKKLYLRNNNLTTIDRNWIVRWDKITDINLGLNPWACDCRNSWFIHSLMKQINSTTPEHTHDITCATPLAWIHRPLLELSDNNKELICENESHPENDSLILVGILVGVLIGIPITLGVLVIYRRGCFGLLYRPNTTSRSLYNRANFADEFHI